MQTAFKIIILAVIIAIAVGKRIAFDLNKSTKDSIVEYITNALDTKANPCEDFYQFTCGGWIANTTIPEESPRIYMADSIIDVRKSAILKGVLQDDPSIDSSLKNFFTSCTDTAEIEKGDAVQILKKYLQVIDEMVERGTSQSLFAAIGWMHSRKIFPFWEFHVEVDSGVPSSYLGQFGQAGLNLPDRSFYLDEESAEMRTLYKNHIAAMFNLLDFENANQRAQDIIQLETQLAVISLPNFDIRDPFKVYNKLSVAAIQALTPNINWTSYYVATSLYNNQYYNIQVPSFFKNLSSIIPSFDRQKIANYMRWTLIHSVADYLPSKFVNETFNFYGKVLLGEDAMPERVSTCIESTDESMGFLLSQYFVKKAFSGESKRVARDMVLNIKAVFKGTLDQVQWMDETTRQRALLKLSQVADMVGYPDEWPTYNFTVSKVYMSNKIDARAEAFAKDRNLLHKPVNRALWQMTPSTINAYYEPTLNEMVFPAGMLQYPYFDKDLPIPVNYGAIGAVQGHELSHGFDDQGRLYDGTGKLENWWTEVVSQRYSEKAQCLVKQYNKFELLPSHFVNGNLTLGENIADNSGLKTAYIAAVKELGPDVHAPSIIPQFTNLQLFFISFGQSWCFKAREEYMKQRLLTDVHAPPKFRVIGTLSNSKEFAEAFKCPLGSRMNPTMKCTLF